MQKRPHPIRVGLEIPSLPSQAIKLLACEGRLCWYSNTLLGYCVKIGMLPVKMLLTSYLWVLSFYFLLFTFYLLKKSYVYCSKENDMTKESDFLAELCDFSIISA